ncbi:hypothetical protein N1030_14865 [Desulfovibrio mangrovi]|uniref:Lar family restriction alleviation protein n=1 Tax=Desulfovibrio mangrovi TaxID=2976983 RepID=UPI002246E61E|nr:Lar family restriction alleviation protein [Desulfovibrio mangrovi]UZP66876.1 hypothetical protein N1030_14865 [Desulfovibrio mangrovi]
MELPKPCTGCGGRVVLLQHDGVYHFVSCEQCEKVGPRTDSPEDALEMWNRSSSTMFVYGEDLRKSRIIKRLECQDRRDDRFVVQIPVVLALGGVRGKRVTGFMRNVSHFGAFLELTGGDVSAVPVGIEEFRHMDTFLFFKCPKEMSKSDGAFPASVQAFRFSPRHLHQRREVVGIGGCFVQLKGEQTDLLDALVRYSTDVLAENM